MGNEGWRGKGRVPHGCSCGGGVEVAIADFKAEGDFKISAINQSLLVLIASFLCAALFM